MSCCVFYLTDGQNEKLYCLLQPECNETNHLSFFNQVVALASKKELLNFSVICEVIERDNFLLSSKIGGPKIQLCGIHTNGSKDSIVLNEDMVLEIFGSGIVELDPSIISEREREEIVSTLCVGLKLKDPNKPVNPLFFMRALNEDIFDVLLSNIQNPHDKHLISLNIHKDAGYVKPKKM